MGGLSCDRTGLNELLEISSANVQGVLVTNISRIGRDVFQVADWNQRLNKSGKKLISMESDESLLNVFEELPLQRVPNKKSRKTHDFVLK